MDEWKKTKKWLMKTCMTKINRQIWNWKAEMKKKALAIRGEASGADGGPSSRQTLTALEERVLGIMGLTAVIGQAETEERGFAALPSERNSLSPLTGNTKQTAHTLCPSQISATDKIMLDFIPSYSIQATPSASTALPSLPPPSGDIPRHAQPLTQALRPRLCRQRHRLPRPIKNIICIKVAKV